MSSRRRLIPLILILALALVPALVSERALSQPSPTSEQIGNQVLQQALSQITAQAAPGAGKRQSVSGGVLATLLDYQRQQAGPSAAAFPPPPPLAVTPSTNGCKNVFSGVGTPPNIRVNQQCDLRRQAEEAIAINPTDSNNLIAGQNDARIGFNHCGIDFSLDRGRTWGDSVPPFYQQIGLAGHTYDAASDPTVVFDTQGNAYFSCILFDINDAQSAVVVAKSNKEFKGSNWHSPNAALGGAQPFSSNPLGIIAQDNNPAVFHDKQFMNVDLGAASPKKDRLYMTWTRFTTNNSPIYFSQSTDGGATWSPGIEISGVNAAICTVGSVAPGACDQDQGSYPIVAPDGTIYVTFYNVNTPLIGQNQHLIVKCPPANACTSPAHWSAPVKVADVFDTAPFFLAPDPSGCPVGRQCLLPNGYRINAFAASAVNPTNGHLYVLWADFRNGGPCASSMGVPVEPCANHNNDIFFVRSTDGGMTWSMPVKVNQDTGTTAQWQPWMTVQPNGAIHAAFYDRSYGACEMTGCNDITAISSTNGGSTWTSSRVTTASMPNLTPVTNSVQAGFLGDYLFLAADSRSAVVVWADTRGLYGTVEEDIYFAELGCGVTIRC